MKSLRTSVTLLLGLIPMFMFAQTFPDTKVEDGNGKVVCVSVDDSRSISRAKAMTKSHDWDGFTLLYDTNRNLYRSLNVVYIPQLFVYDRKGRQIHSQTGYSAGDELETIKIIEK